MVFVFLWALAALQPSDDFRAIRSFRCDFTESTGRTHLEGEEPNLKSPPR